MSHFTWIDTFQKISKWLLNYEDKQTALIKILQDIGVEKGLEDKDDNGKVFLLDEIDPFTFISLILKFGEKQRNSCLHNLKDLTINLDFEIPTDYLGVPSIRAMKAWFFGYQKDRKNDDIKKLWDLFKAIHSNQNIENLFNAAVRIKFSGVSKLTQILFLLFPSKFIPVDAQTYSFLNSRRLIKNKNHLKKIQWQEYEKILKDLGTLNTPFSALSYRCWFTNTYSTVNSKNLDDLLSIIYKKITKDTEQIKEFTNNIGKQLVLEVADNSNCNLIVNTELPEKLSINRIYRGIKNSNFSSKVDELTGKTVYIVGINKRNTWDYVLNILDYYDGVDKMINSQEKEKVISDNNITTMEINEPLNQILFGPPGTGKTYTTTELAVKIVDPEWYSKITGPKNNHQLIKNRYDELIKKGRIAFTTFHQSFSYEDFIEGLKAYIPDDQDKIAYKVEDGIFKDIATSASKSEGISNTSNIGLNNEPKIWKISIAEVGNKKIRDKYIKSGEIRIGWNNAGDLTKERSEEQMRYYEQLGSNSKSSLNEFLEGISCGDVVLCFKDNESIQAIGIVESDYQFDCKHTRDDYAHVRKVKWLVTGINFNILKLNSNKKLVQKTVYELSRMTWAKIIDELDKQQIKLPEVTITDTKSDITHNYVLIIDEINRGNISKIFGELITLIEDDKRSGRNDQRELMLPYSKEPFSVPANLYIIGTMNTADKSLAQLDLALRRRFVFKEFSPNYEILKEANQYDLDVAKMLEMINKRIQVLKGRDYQIGHSYFMPLCSKFINQDSYLQCLRHIFINKIIPLLQEYFYSSLQNIALILNDNPDSADEIKIIKNVIEEQSELFYGIPAKLNPSNFIELNLAALNSIQRFKEIY